MKHDWPADAQRKLRDGYAITGTYGGVSAMKSVSFGMRTELDVFKKHVAGRMRSSIARWINLTAQWDACCRPWMFQFRGSDWWVEETELDSMSRSKR